MTSPALGERFGAALQMAHRLHRHQLRKGTRVPYLSHLLAVASLVLEAGGDEDQAIAALLHDAAEDQGGELILSEIEEQFGARVAGYVEACSDTLTSPKPPWRERKERYLARLAAEEGAARLISLADKLHNARSILADLRRVGAQAWQRFNGGREGTLWYYRSLCILFLQSDDTGMAKELQRVLAEIEFTDSQHEEAR